MNAAEWSRVNEIFAAALDLPSEKRSLFLGRECATDREARLDVDRLLAEHERTSGVLDRPLFAAAPQIEEEFATGHMLGSRYRIERFIACGGMASVYLARDQQVADRRVIVKFLHAWARQYAWLKSKFRQEMEALARIDHHSVVGVLDAGETSDGLPFLVIEYIDGETLRSEMQRGAMDLARVARIIGETGRAVPPRMPKASCTAI
jgi:hypothetical protein